MTNVTLNQDVVLTASIIEGETKTLFPIVNIRAFRGYAFLGAQPDTKRWEIDELTIATHTSERGEIRNFQSYPVVLGTPVVLIIRKDAIACCQEVS